LSPENCRSFDFVLFFFAFFGFNCLAKNAENEQAGLHRQQVFLALSNKCIGQGAWPQGGEACIRAEIKAIDWAKLRLN